MEQRKPKHLKPNRSKISARSEKKRGHGPGRRWKPGESGNPAGRPPVPPEYKAALRMLEPEALEALGEIIRDRFHVRRGQTAEYIINRQRGTPINRAEIAGPDGEPVRITYDDVRKKLGAMAERVANAGDGAPPDKD